LEVGAGCRCVDAQIPASLKITGWVYYSRGSDVESVLNFDQKDLAGDRRSGVEVAREYIVGRYLDNLPFHKISGEALGCGEGACIASRGGQGQATCGSVVCDSVEGWALEWSF